MINETFYVLVSYHQLAFTDYVSRPAAKNLMGWSMVMFSLVNLIYPNLWMVIKGIYVSYKESKAEKLAMKTNE